MAVARRLYVALFVLPLLMLLVGNSGMTAHAQPSAVPVPELSGWKIPNQDQIKSYDYESVAYLRNVVKWDSPDLEPAALSKWPAEYYYPVGTEEHRQIQPVEAFDSTSSVNNSEGFFQL
jgi:hypothetical protein